MRKNTPADLCYMAGGGGFDFPASGLSALNLLRSELAFEQHVIGLLAGGGVHVKILEEL